jgi:hypothetical protein
LKKRIFISIFIIIVLCGAIFWAVTPKRINASKVINLQQSNYKSITINDIHVEAGTNKQYLIDDFIPKLANYTIITYKGELPKNYSYKVLIENKDGSTITLLDEQYLVVNNVNYKILSGIIGIDTLYKRYWKE